MDFDGIDQDTIKRERAKARKLRKSRWWQRKISSGFCHYCGKKIAPEDLTMDHVVPLAQGGQSTKLNIVPACKACNTNKKCSSPFDWQKE